MKVETGVIAAAGSGTRMLPVTLGYPKELLPIINKPAIQLIIDEYVDSAPNFEPVKKALKGLLKTNPMERISIKEAISLLTETVASL